MEEFQKFRWGRSPPHLLEGGGAILIWTTEIDAEEGGKCGQRKEEEKNVCGRACISRCDRCILRWPCNRSKVVLQSFQGGRKTFDLSQAT